MIENNKITCVFHKTSSYLFGKEKYMKGEVAIFLNMKIDNCVRKLNISMFLLKLG